MNDLVSLIKDYISILDRWSCTFYAQLNCQWFHSFARNRLYKIMKRWQIYVIFLFTLFFLLSHFFFKKCFYIIKFLCPLFNKIGVEKKTVCWTLDLSIHQESQLGQTKLEWAWIVCAGWMGNSIATTGSHFLHPHLNVREKKTLKNHEYFLQ